MALKPFYPLDIPSLSVLGQLRELPYPAAPSGILVSESIFRLSLNPWTPALFGVVYLIAAKWSNSRLRGDGPKPTDLVKASYGLGHAVLAHNAFLAAYSAWTFVNVTSIVLPYFLGGMSHGGIDGFQNAFCTVPTHDASADKLGRYVTLFYYSKFYEVIDSLILALKGKPVGNLQSYHHAGAMITMWAGVRYSASPIWIFATFNSFVHSLMYFYYVATTMQWPFPKALKSAMTKIQITQLIVGFFTAASYLVIRYRPDAYPTGSLPSPGDFGAAITQANDAAQWNGAGNFSAPTGPMDTAAVKNRLNTSIDERQTTTCVSTTGHAFAVVLNLSYLIPLIYLFVQFYVRSYRRGASTPSSAAKKAAAATDPNLKEAAASTSTSSTICGTEASASSSTKGLRQRA